MDSNQIIPNEPYGFVPTMEHIHHFPENGKKVISLFSGVGGSSLGYKMAGFDVIAAVEFLDYQAATYRHNHPNTKLYQQDIRTLDPIKIMEELNLAAGELDVLDGSPPCSAFSNSGSREKGWGKEKTYGNTKQRTDDLFFEYERFLKIMQPKVFVAENVTGLVQGKAKGYFKMIFKALQDCGYNVRARILKASHYGVAQGRERIIFIGVRKDLDIQPSYPEPNSKIFKVKEAWNNLPAPSEEDLVSATISPELKSYKWASFLKKGERGNKYHPKGSYFNLFRINDNSVSPTILQTNHYMTIHPNEFRALHITELKRITSFPDDFQLLGTYQNQFEACGRTVPPLMMYEIAKNIGQKILN